MIRKISGKPTGTKIPHLHVNNSEVTGIPDIANSLAQTFCDNSSSEQYSTKFQSFCRQAENNPLNFKSNDTETYNNPFSMELVSECALKHLFGKLLYNGNMPLLYPLILKNLMTLHGSMELWKIYTIRVCVVGSELSLKDF